MRDYQTKTNVGGGADSIVSTKFGAGEFNSLATENENAVTRAGLTLAPANGSGEVTTQLAQSLFTHAVKSQQFQDGGSANTHELTPISGASGVLLPADYGALDGARIWFSPGASNTGASTVNIGQSGGALIGAKALLSSDGSALSGGELRSGVDVEIIYSSTADGGSGGWLLSSASEALNEAYGECFLSYSAPDVVLSRSGGRRITIDGVVRIIPNAGVSLAPTGLTPDTVYFVYAHMNSGTMTLEASTTGHARDAVTGVQVKTGDASRTLVGMVRPVTGPAFTDTVTQRFVRSWFNRTPAVGRNTFSANRATGSGSLTELNSEIRTEFLAWTGESIFATLAGKNVNSGSFENSWRIITGDGESIAETQAFAGNSVSSALAGSISATFDGYRYVSLEAAVGSGTGTWFGDASGAYVSTITTRVG